MAKYLLIIFLLLICLESHSQQKLIAGTIKNAKGEPVDNAFISQKGSNRRSYSDSYGAFHLTLVDSAENSISFWRRGYRPLFTNKADTIQGFISIILEEDSTFGANYSTSPVQLKPKPIREYFVMASFQIDYIPFRFNRFESILGSKNLEIMNRAQVGLTTELGGIYKNFYGGLSFGFAGGSELDKDSLDRKFDVKHYGLHMGATLVDSKYFLLIPKAGIRLTRSRLVNYDKDWEIPIGQYIENRDLDIRFNQLTGSIGLLSCNKFYDKNGGSSFYGTTGLYGGYVFLINEKPWLTSKENKLKSDQRILLANFYFGMQISMNFGIKNN